MHQVSRFAVGEGLDAERQLLERIQQGEQECALLLWRPQEAALVMPQRMSRLAGFAEAEAECQALGWPVALRDSGGEPVPQSPAVLNVALAYALPPRESEMTRIENAYLRLCHPMLDWLAGMGLEGGWAKWTAPSATAATTSPWRRASWSAPHNAGAAATAIAAMWCWPTPRC